MKYADITFNDRNPVKRRLQRIRLDHALKVLEELPDDFAGRVLDFGAGNGELSRQIARRFPRAIVIAYEPVPDLNQEAREHLEEVPQVQVVASLKEFSRESFDLIFALEVFEHLPDGPFDEALEQVTRLAQTGASLVFGVPNELFLPALVKGLFRMTRRFGEVDAVPGNILRASLGKPPTARPVKEIAPGLPYIVRHMGFDYRRFREELARRFRVWKIYGSPFPFLPPALNFEVYFLCQK